MTFTVTDKKGPWEVSIATPEQIAELQTRVQELERQLAAMTTPVPYVPHWEHPATTTEEKR